MRVFSETQSYSWVFMVIAFLLLTGVGALAWRYVARKLYLFLALLPFTLLVLYLLTERLDTRIDDTGIYYRMFPGQLTERSITWHEIESIMVKDYIVYSRRSFIYDVYSIDDQWGLYIILKDGRKIILGSKKPQEIRDAISEMRFVKRTN